MDVDGSIVAIRVRNFFCHDNLEVIFNRNVTFIVGRNGSGKSAILTALVVGLGGRASCTNRGSKLQEFVKKGTNSATIEIKIKNSSSRAYRHNIYGDYITIVRNISASGGSSYKIKSATGDVISTKFEEVNAIVVAHDIQVDNPISVLNQDDARSFHASDAKKKYSLFLKATNLDLTENNYLRALDNCKKATVLWNKKKEACLVLEKECQKWKKSYDELQSQGEVEELKEVLQNEYYWSEISSYENEANKIQAQYDKEQYKMDKLAEKLSNIVENYGSGSAAIDALKVHLKEYNQHKTALEQDLRSLEAEINTVQSSLRSTQNQNGKHKETINREKRKIADLETEIQNIGSGDAESRRAELQARAARARDAAAAARARADTAQHDAEQARHNVAHAQGQADHAAAKVQRKRDEFTQKKQQLRELESRGNDSLAVYGNNMSELCRRVSEASAKGHFSAPPRGPIGAYLKVKEKKWGGALEHIIGGSIQSFCVNTTEDSRKLFQIMGQVYKNAPKPSVTCSKFLSVVHDVRSKRVSARPYVSALDSIDVSDPVIANFLIDNIRMESVLLVPTHEDAIRLSDNVENVPQNCSKIVTLDSTEFYPAPNYRSYGGSNRQSRYLHLSIGERKNQLLTEIQETQLDLRKLERKAEEFTQVTRQARDAERAASKALQALLAKRHEMDEACRAAAAALDQQQAPQHAVLVDELNISKEKLNSLNKQVEELSAKETACRRKINELEANMKEKKYQFSQLMNQCRTLTEEIDQEQMKLDREVTERRTYEQSHNEIKMKLKKVEDILVNKRKVIETRTEAALRLGPRFDNPRDIGIVSDELKKTQLKLRSIRSDGMTKADVAKKVKQVDDQYQSTFKTLRSIKKLIDKLNAASGNHLRASFQIQRHIADRVHCFFQAHLSVRGYSGYMHINITDGTLEMFCTGREGGDKRLATSTSSLSGGERSYSTVSFIMALWQCVEVPFCFMDEFDVFMDNVNRKIVMELLLDHARTNTNRQFVFLTPQDASSVQAGPQVTIYTMADPRP